MEDLVQRLSNLAVAKVDDGVDPRVELQAANMEIARLRGENATLTATLERFAAGLLIAKQIVIAMPGEPPLDLVESLEALVGELQETSNG